MLGGVEVIRALGSEATFIARFRAALHDGLAAYNRATVYAAPHIPLMVMLLTLAMALVPWGGGGRPGSAGVLGPLAGHAHGLCPALTALCGADYEPGQRVADRPGGPRGAGAHLPGAGAAVRGLGTRGPAPAALQEQHGHGDAGGGLWVPAQP